MAGGAKERNPHRARRPPAWACLLTKAHTDGRLQRQLQSVTVSICVRSHNVSTSEC